MKNYTAHLLLSTESIKTALTKLNLLGEYLTLFIIDSKNKIVGSVTDGDIRRALLSGFTIDDTIDKIMYKNFSYIVQGKFTINQISEIKRKKIKLVPIVDEDLVIKRLINLEEMKSVLPVEAIIMAGGEGRRMRPFTELIPKPLLIVGDKPIIDYNIDRLAEYGIQKIHISIKYLGHLIEEYLEDGKSRNLSISYIKEEEPLGTIGSVSLIKDFCEEYAIVLNSDLLTNIDYEDFFNEFINNDADMAVATIPYNVDIPYAVLETTGNNVISFKEKPTYTYYSNAGIYLLKKELLEMIPMNKYFNATDLMEQLIQNGKKLLSYPLLGYWLDVGKHEDFIKAQEDIKHIKF